ncbi:uncharacterized protein BDZ99DRAFT_577116 [Mytilinidion resinicola]|uniref:Uncharacterized protein n=1 Tax=Mytilinidion resinicola TaxID=574789 RepID=A0A6A6Y016_9PEZI|nr:uncharacterized protein BDZ99DRAFT_577116 [Mytilinidion resinicola]KAF2802151.1 hypothetical protein BDZ99DRAFT_577116 [Mytilinidion resinicola]
MRFALATLLFVPALIAAAPTPDERVVIMIEGTTLSRDPAEQSKTPKPHDLSFKPSDVCWRICGDRSLPCPDGWESRQFGSCYTCCVTEKSN